MPHSAPSPFAVVEIDVGGTSLNSNEPQCEKSELSKRNHAIRIHYWTSSAHQNEAMKEFGPSSPNPPFDLNLQSVQSSSSLSS